MGLRMFEDTARDIETLSRGLPKDFTYRRFAKAIPPGSMKLDADSRTDVSTITTDAKDRDGEVVLPSGGDWQNYNNVVTFAHQYDELPVGSCLWMKSTPNAIIACTQYPSAPPDHQGPWLPSAILHLMQQPVPTCTGKSIGFLPLSVRQATGDEIAKRPEMKSCPVIDRWVGIEYAVAPVPANPTSEMMVVSKCAADHIIDEHTAELVRKAMGAFAPRIVKQPAPVARRATIVVPFRSKAMSDTPAPTPGPAAYQHLDFQPTKEVVQAHKDGVARHDAGETKGHATPETMAMAKHLAMGGEASPGFCKKCKAFHDAAPNHVAAKPGTPAFALAQLHGGAAGKAFYDATCKAMDLADAAPGPGPATAIDENGGTPSPTTAGEPATKQKDASGSSEGVSADGGYDAIAASMTMPMCKACKTNADVMLSKAEDGSGAMDAATGHPKFECKMCGKSWAEPATIAPKSDGVSEQPHEHTNSDTGDASNIPGGTGPTAKAMTEDEEAALAERIIELQMHEITEKVMAEVEDRLILMVGGV